MNPLALLSGLSPRLIGGLVIAAAMAAIYAGHLVDVRNHEKRAHAAGVAEEHARWDAQKVLDLAAANKAQADARAEEQRRTAAQREALDEHERLATRARADHDGAVSARDRLLDAAGAVVAGSGLRAGDPATASSCPAAATLRDVLGDSADALVELAGEADAARNAGATCERAYDALIAAPAAAASQAAL